jgi:hypothetical protein
MQFFEPLAADGGLMPLQMLEHLLPELAVG